RRRRRPAARRRRDRRRRPCRAARRGGRAGGFPGARPRAGKPRPRRQQRGRDRSRDLSADRRAWRRGGEGRMTRIVTVGAAQLGPIGRDETRPQVVERLLALLRQGKAMGCDLVVFPELALTTFFPRWFMTDEAQIDAYFERAMPG